MEAAIGTRFGTGINQFASIDSSSCFFMGYSIHDIIHVKKRTTYIIVAIKNTFKPNVPAVEDWIRQKSVNK